MTLYLVALATLVAGALAGPLLRRQPVLALRVSSALLVLGSLLGLAAVVPFLLGAAPVQVVLPWSEPIGAFRLRLDPLGAFFQVALFVVAATATAAGATSMREAAGRRGFASFLLAQGLLLVAISLVLAAADAILFLVAWEVMTVTSFVLVTFDDERQQVRSAGYVYLVASHVGAACLVALFLALGKVAGGFDFLRFEALRGAGAGPVGLLLGLGIVGFGTKAGLVPLHVWLPEAHPAAPSHVSALLSAVMVKTGVYGLLRLTSFLPPLAPGHGALIAFLGLGSALVAITLTLAQGDIKRALAYSTVENVGIILLGVGLSLFAAATGHPTAAALALAGALFHVWSHVLMKGLAFLGAGTLSHAVHTQDMERMGGLLARLPVSGTLFIVAAAALSALPPLAGFASEWLLYLGLLSTASETAGATALIGFLAVATLALVGALAALSFTRIVGVALLGAPRSAEAAHAHEVAPAGWLPLTPLAAGAVVLGLFPTLALRLIAPVAAQLGVADLGPALSPAVALSSRLRIAVLAVLAVVAVLLFIRRRRVATVAPARSETWGCGFAAPTPRMQYTASSFAQLLLASVAPRPLAPRTHARLPRGIFPTGGSFRTEPREPARTSLFDPIFRVVADRMSRLRRYQARHLNLQLLYTLVTLVALLALMAWRGS